MAKQIGKYKSIKTVLTAHKNELYALMDDNYEHFDELVDKVDEILASDELASNPDVPKARAVLKKCACNYNYYYTTLVTYMTALKVS